VVGGSLLAVLVQAAFSVPQWRVGAAGGDHPSSIAMPTTTAIGEGLLGVRADALSKTSAQQAGVLSGYLLPFEIVSVHLLVVLIGAAYLARAKRRRVMREVEG
jgi:hypothetical protein